MSVQILTGLDGIDMADIPEGGGLATVWTPVGSTYRDEATLEEADPTETDHLSNESDDPIAKDIAGGKKTLKFNLVDFDPDNLVKYLGGTATGTAPKVWNAPAQKELTEAAFRIRSKNGGYISFPRCSFFAKADYKLAPSGIAKVIVTATVMSPTGAVAPMIKGTLP